MPLSNYIFVIGFVIFSACRAQKTPEESLMDVIHARLPHADLIYNLKGDYVLCVEKANQPVSGRLRFLILKTDEKKLIAEGSFLPGYIKWITNDEVEVVDAPGIITGNEDLQKFKKIYNVRESKSLTQ